MKRLKFNDLFLIASLIAFIGHRNIFTSLILVFASVNMITDVIPKLWRTLRDAKK